METAKGELKHGLLVDDEIQKSFEMRQATTGDMFDAEELATSDNPIAYQGALISLQLVKLGNMDGPIPFPYIRKLHPEDFGILVDVQRETERLGES